MFQFGATLLIIGLTQMAYQVWLWTQTSVWHGLSFLTLFRHLGLGEPVYGWGPVRTVAELVLSTEVSFAIAGLGLYLVVARPVAAVVQEINLQRRLARTRRELRAQRGSAA